MLAWNQRTVRRLTAVEIWLFIVGRGLAAFGLGIVAVGQFPHALGSAGWPIIIAGVILLIIAGKGMISARHRA